MKRKEIRRVLKKWVYKSSTEYNSIEFLFMDTGVKGSKMSKEFESLVDEVYKMIQKEKNEETTNQSTINNIVT